MVFLLNNLAFKSILLDGDSGLILTCLTFTPIAFIVSIIKDYNTDKGSEYDVSFIKVSDTQKYLSVLGKKLIWNFFLSVGFFSIFYFFIIILDFFSGDYSFKEILLSKDLYILILHCIIIYISIDKNNSI